MLLNDLETLEFLFESLCERDLKIYAESIDAHIYHYQDYKEREIDSIEIQINDDVITYLMKDRLPKEQGNLSFYIYLE